MPDFQTALPIADLPPYDPRNPRPWFFTVVWQGNYLFDFYQEGDGSHPGVDIDATKYPDGKTEVFSCAAGEVKIAHPATPEEDNFLVIEHPSAPDPEKPGETTTLFSIYRHLSSFCVAAGQSVSVGQKIGITGSTGQSTGPHLHFQIDRAGAPHQPFWPFSKGEREAAGFSSFWEAVNAGFQKERVPEWTVNPLPFLQSFLPGTAFPDSFSSPEEKAAVELLASREIVAGYGDGWFRPEQPISRAELLKVSFLAFGKEIGWWDSHFPSKFSDIPWGHWAQSFINAAVDDAIVSGYADGSFRPDAPVTRAEGMKILLLVAGVKTEEPAAAPFTDAPLGSWFAPFAAAAKNRRLLPFTEFFQPSRPLSRGEACQALVGLLS